MEIRRFNRYELKYLIHASEYRRLVKDLENFMSPDPHGDVDGFYRVTSLYYDSPDFQCYRAKMDGLLYRRKLRLRIYPGNNILEVKKGFVEIKQRMNRTVQKRRIILPLSEAKALCHGDLQREFDDPQDAAVASEVTYLVKAARLRPTCIVSYRRRAFTGSRLESGMRLTFDMQLQGRVTALTVNEPAHNHYFMPPDWLIMEVKVNDRIPDWMTALIAKHECQLRRVSKYCAVVEAGLRRFNRLLSAGGTIEQGGA
jgi:hypothetical protein